MSSYNKDEYIGVSVSKPSQYDRLNKAYSYNCLHKNAVYKDFNNGINCLCASGDDERSTMDMALNTGNQVSFPPLNGANQTLGWK